jgi:hypothetical protein
LYAAVEGVIDQIRTALTQLVAELRAIVGAVEEVPSAEAASQAVGLVVTGKRARVQVTTAQATGSQTTATALNESQIGQRSSETGFWTRWRKVGAFVVGLATVVGAVAAILQFV